MLLQHRNRTIFIWPVLSFEHPFLFNNFCARIFAFLILLVEFQAEQANAYLFQNACSIFVAILTRFSCTHVDFCYMFLVQFKISSGWTHFIWKIKSHGLFNFVKLFFIPGLISVCFCRSVPFSVHRFY